MNARGPAIFRGFGIALLTIAYAMLALLVELLMCASTLGVCLAIGPVLVIAAAIAWRSRFPAIGLMLCTLAAALVYRYLPFMKQHFAWVYLLQQSAAYALLAFTFGRTLSGGRLPLCTRFAIFVHGTLDAAAMRYTRNVTLSWTVFFLCMTFALIGLYALASVQVWSFFANFCTLPLIAAMFAAEYAVRTQALPHMKHSGILVGVRAYLASDGQNRALRRG